MKTFFPTLLFYITSFPFVSSFFSSKPRIVSFIFLTESAEANWKEVTSISSQNSLHATYGRRRQMLQSLTLFISSLIIPSSMALSMSSINACVDIQKVLVIGANGKTGSRIIDLLHAASNFEPIAMIRDADQASRLKERGISYFIHDLDSSSIPVEKLEGAHAVIFAAGAGLSRPPIKKVTIDYLSAVQSIVASQEARSVKRFILLSGINSDPMGSRRSLDSTDLSGPLSAWHRLKAHSETYLKECHFHGRAIDWTILCPGRLVDDPDSKGTGKIKCSLIHGEDGLKESLTNEEKEAAVKVMSGSHDGKSERLCISRDNTAVALVALLNAENTIGKVITVVDGILPVNEVIAAI